MKTLSLKTLFDALFASFAVFFASFILLNYFLDRPFSIIFAVCLSSFALIFSFALIDKKEFKLIKKTQNSKRISELLFALSLMDREKIIPIFCSALKNLDIQYKILNKSIRLVYKNTQIFPVFSPDGVKKSDVVYAYNLLSDEETVQIFCNEASNEVLSFAKRFNKRITIISGEQVFSLLEKADNLPKLPIELKTTKPKFSMENFILKKRAKNFLVYGFAFYLLSFISPIKLYYIIIGSIFILLSAIIKLFGRSDSNKSFF